jgi:chemotaxis protein methyltransferase CheR
MERADPARPVPPVDGMQRLAAGPLSDEDADELRALKQLIEERLGFQSAGYKERCLRRRLAVRMRACAVHRYADYRAILERSADERRRLLDTVTINVSKFFRNREVWELIRTRVLAELARAPGREIRIWSAGSAAGEEAYSLAILLLELARTRPLDLERFRIVATDIDQSILAVARLGAYGPFAFSEIDPELRERWFEGPQLERVKPEVRRLVSFETLDLITDPFPADRHLILCRNVIIYFERAVQEALFRRFHEALAPGGHLVLGKVETLHGTMARTFQAVAPRERIFRKP